MNKVYKINPQNENISVKILLDRINNGYELQEIEGDLTYDEILKYNGSIIIAPDYQREYRFTLEDEVKLVESVLLGIPIPPIFLATDKYKGVRVVNVVDGQHRLRALHRFYNNEFKLNSLELLSSLNGNDFRTLDIGLKSDYLEAHLLTITFNDFPGLEFEMEIFSRYNKGTKPLSPQEIRHAAYNSKFNEFVNEFCYTLNKKTELSKLNIAYNATKDRIQKKKLQEGLFVILSILELGINSSYDKSLIYAEEYMKNKKIQEKQNSYIADENFKHVINTFHNFNKFVERIQEKVEYPFSKEIYGVSSRNYKFQISIAMILAGIYNRLLNTPYIIENIIKDDDYRDAFLNYLEGYFNNSFLEDPTYNASSTNSKMIQELIDRFNFK